MARDYTTLDHLIREFGELGWVIVRAFAEVDHHGIIGEGRRGGVEDYASYALRVAERLTTSPRGTRDWEDVRSIVINSFNAAELFYGVVTRQEAGEIAKKILEKVHSE
jgi:hypothetical protein